MQARLNQFIMNFMLNRLSSTKRRRNATKNWSKPNFNVKLMSKKRRKKCGKSSWWVFRFSTNYSELHFLIVSYCVLCAGKGATNQRESAEKADGRVAQAARAETKRGWAWAKPKVSIHTQPSVRICEKISKFPYSLLAIIGNWRQQPIVRNAKIWKFGPTRKRSKRNWRQTNAPLSRKQRIITN